MSTSGTAVRGDEGRAVVYARATTLGELLDLVLDDLRETTPFARMVLVASCEGRAGARWTGVPREAAEQFAEEVGRRSRPGARALAGDALREAAAGSLASSMARVTTVGLRPIGSFRVGVAVDAEPGGPELDKVHELLRLAGPFLHRCAEIDALRASVGALRRAERLAAEALNAVSDPVLVMDCDARTRLANRRATNLFVSTPEDGPGRRRAVETNNLFFSALRARLLLKQTGGAVSRELLLVDPRDGSDLHFEVSITPSSEEGRVEGGSIFVLQDVSALRHATHELQAHFARSVAAEHEARRESERLNVVIENAGVPILVTDARTNVLLMNQEAERLLSEAGEGPRAAPRREGVLANNAKLEGILHDFLLQSRLRLKSRLTLVDPGQATEFPALALSTKILDEHFEPSAVVTILRDLTQEVENRRLAQELSELNAQLEERVSTATHEIAERNLRLERQSAALERASRLKSEFLATMSHELRTPINAVLGYNSLLREGIFGPLSSGQEDALLRMRKAAEHLLSVINDILDLSRVEAGRVQVSVSEIDLRVFLEDIAGAIEPIAERKGLGFELKLDAHLPPVRTDGTRLRQVVLNLLSNAVKFTESGSVTLVAGPLRGGEAAFVEVVDTGVGIDEADWERIFEEFTQVDQSATREHGGAGLGLAISRKLMRIMGGTLRVESRAGKGTTFRVELPVVPPVAWGDAATAPLR